MEQTTIKVSVIIPVYNPGIGIYRCIKSLQNQTLKEIEMIFIDDCGTDDAIAIVQEAAMIDDRIKVISNAHNEGAGPSRNLGISAAEGKYLSFVDADDYIAVDFLEQLYKKAVDTSADIVKGTCISIDERDNITTTEDARTLNDRIKKGLADGKAAFVLFSYQHTSAIYRREMIISEDCYYGLSSIREDLVFLLKACYKARNIEFAERANYYYLSREDSEVRSFSVKRWYDAKESLIEMLQYIEKEKIFTQDGYRFAVTYIISQLSMLNYYRDYDETVDCDRMLKDIRTIVLSINYSDELIKEDVIVEGLVYYMVNLAVTPYGEIWREVPYSEYEERVDAWVSFLTAHPEYGKKSQKYIWRVFERAIMYNSWDGRREKRQCLREVRRKALSLPNLKILTDQYISMSLFVNTGINIFQLRDTGFGKAVKKVLAGFRRSRLLT